MKIVTQFLRDVDWGPLDYFLVDMPPGTGDAQLSLVQATHVSGALIVTTPQEMAVGDALRGARMFERVGVPVLGIVENMSGFVDPESGRRLELFSSGGGRRLAEELGVELLGSIPLQPRLAELADRGRPILVAEPDSAAAVRAPARRRASSSARPPAARRRSPSCAADRPRADLCDATLDHAAGSPGRTGRRPGGSSHRTPPPPGDRG